MPNFDNGVSGYIVGTCSVQVHFPVDSRGKADVCCEQCPYYGRNSRTCQLNKRIVNYPEKYIGAACPLSFSGEIEEDNNG